MTLALTDIIDATGRQAIAVIKMTSNVSLLTEALEAEEARKRKRGAVIGALNMRIDTLKEDAAAPVIVEADPVIKTDLPAPVVTDRTPIENCATAFLAALKSGDVALTTIFIGEVRSEGADDAAMAAALVAEFAKFTAVKKTATQRKSGAYTDKMFTKVKAGVDAGVVAEDGTITLDDAVMIAASWAKSWRTYSSPWSKGEGPGSAVRTLGFTPKLKDGVLTLTPSKDADEALPPTV